jgi:hypothetical protein
MSRCRSLEGPAGKKVVEQPRESVAIAGIDDMDDF